jgi:hypothetical protein
VTSRVELKDLVADASDLLVRGHGFTRTGRKFIREDELVRSAWFIPTGFGRFDLLFDLGIVGISVILPEKSARPASSERWVVRLNAMNLRPKDVPAMAWLTLTKGQYDREVRKQTRHICERVTDEFLLKYSTVEEFYMWVRGSALEILRNPNADNEWRQLKLWPSNSTMLLELAGVYAAYLGKSDDENMLQQTALDDAIAVGVDYAVPRIIASIADAGRRQGRSWAMEKPQLVEELRKSVDHGVNAGITSSAVRRMLGRDFEVPSHVYNVPGESFTRIYVLRQEKRSRGTFEYEEIQRLLDFTRNAGPSTNLEMLLVTTKNGRMKTMALVDSGSQSVVFWSTMWQF